MARISLADAKLAFERNGYRVTKWASLYVVGNRTEMLAEGITGHEVVRLAKELGYITVVPTHNYTPITFTDRKFGVEIEVFHPTDRNIREKIARTLNLNGIDCQSLGYTHTVLTSWKVVTDGSIHGGYGAEVVSPVLSWFSGLQQLKKVLELLDSLGCQVNRSTGLHVHHDMNGDERHLKSVFEFYKLNENLFDSLLPNSRRLAHNQYCNSLHSFNYESWRHGTRYVKLNAQSFAKYGTIEVRHHSGTTNFDKVEHWIKLTQAMIEYCVSGRTVIQYHTLEEMLSALNLNQAWYLERREELA